MQGDFYKGVVGTTGRSFSLTAPFNPTVNTDDGIFGGNLLGRWTHKFEDGSDMQLQVYYDLVAGDELGISLDEHTFDVDFQHHFQADDRNDIVWGMGYRLNAAQFDGNFTVSFNDEHRTDHLASAFFQDDIALVDDELRLTLGSKFEYNTYTGFEVQPTARLLWTPDQQQSIWLAASRATRTPSQAEDSIVLNSVAPPGSTTPPIPVPLQLSVLGSSDQRSEDVLAFELGYRVRPDDNFSVDIATFYDIYDHLATVEPQPGLAVFPCATPPFFVCALGTSRFDNRGSAETYGIEVAADIRPASWWQLHPAYTFLVMNLERDAGSGDPLIEHTDGRNPTHQISMRSAFDLGDDWDLDIWARYVSDLPERGVDSYFTFDTRLGWRPLEGVELAIVGQNLIAGHHLEFTPELVDTTPTEVERSVYGKVTVTF